MGVVKVEFSCDVEEMGFKAARSPTIPPNTMTIVQSTSLVGNCLEFPVRVLLMVTKGSCYHTSDEGKSDRSSLSFPNLNK